MTMRLIVLAMLLAGCTNTACPRAPDHSTPYSRCVEGEYANPSLQRAASAVGQSWGDAAAEACRLPFVVEKYQ